MSSPTDTAPLRPDEIEALGERVSDLLAGRDDGVTYPTESARQAAAALARSLHEEPAPTLRALQMALRRVQLDVQEDAFRQRSGRRAGA